jgi:hypothetical protein
MRITKFSLAFGNADVPVEIGVREGDSERTIRWLPQGDPLPVQRVDVREQAGEGDCVSL